MGGLKRSILYHVSAYVPHTEAQGPLVRKPINANPRLKVNQDFQLTRYKCFKKLILS